MLAARAAPRIKLDDGRGQPEPRAVLSRDWKPRPNDLAEGRNNWRVKEGLGKTQPVAHIKRYGDQESKELPQFFAERNGLATRRVRSLELIYSYEGWCRQRKVPHWVGFTGFQRSPRNGLDLIYSLWQCRRDRSAGYSEASLGSWYFADPRLRSPVYNP